MSYRGTVTAKDATDKTVSVQIPYLAPGQEYGPMQSCVDVTTLSIGDAVLVAHMLEGSSDDYIVLAKIQV